VRPRLLLVATLAWLCACPVSGQSTVRATRVVSPPYPLTMQYSGMQGVVRFEARVTPSGRIDTSTVRVSESSHEMFVVALKRTLPQWRFPAQRPGAQRNRVVAHVVRWILLPADATDTAGLVSCPPDTRSTTTVCARPIPSNASRTY